MPLHKYKQAVQYLFVLMSQHNLTGIKDALDSDCVVHHADLPEGSGGREAYLQLLSATFDAFPDARVRVDEIVGEGNPVAVRYTFAGTQRGEYLGIAPAGKEVKITGIGIFRMSGNKVDEMWLQPDRLGLMRQLGALP